jgi:hypothetical protein
VTNFNNRIKLSQANPVTWQTNTGIIRSISKKGTTDGGKGGVVPLHLVDLAVDPFDI